MRKENENSVPSAVPRRGELSLSRRKKAECHRGSLAFFAPAHCRILIFFYFGSRASKARYPASTSGGRSQHENRPKSASHRSINSDVVGGRGGRWRLAVVFFSVSLFFSSSNHSLIPTLSALPPPSQTLAQGDDAHSKLKAEGDRAFAKKDVSGFVF